VHQGLLGRVFRKGVGWQVTYAGHPLYLFDQQPGAVTGAGWFEPGLPPWHGIWWLLSPGGQPVPWAGTLTTAKVGGKTVLAEPFITGIGWVKFPVYTFSGDLATYGTTCAEITACAPAPTRSPGTAGRSTCSPSRPSCPHPTAAASRSATATGSRPSAARSAWSSTRNHDQRMVQRHCDGTGRGTRVRYMYRPPFTGKTPPVMYPDSGSARNSTTRATSFGSPSRPTGIRVTILSIAAAGTAAVMSVVM
jgi:hypothetical protein